MDMRMQGRRVLVTGAAGGIGRAAARAFAAEGAHVAVTDRDAAALTSLATELRATGVPASAHPADVTIEADVAAAVRAAAADLGGLDAVVMCAGISGPVGTMLADTATAAWDAVFDVNVRGAFLVLRAAIPALRTAGGGDVVVVASDSALLAAPGMVPYCASKAAVLQLARAAAVELQGVGIRVNAICPSIVDTPMSRGDLGIDGDDPAGFADSGYPVQTAAEVAAQLVFLASPVSRPVNGAALVSDFGYSARSSFPA
ncbi:SDR family NAD(P)-dependent oxidoreductase [Microbacterium sp. NPDC058389]|uniref:SDR family NAD(P)-dependent oxidoreductase n=1 Tax=Microbacterium sp. NPDC058389 TaxID=3346475 RepID=UPI003655F16D